MAEGDGSSVWEAADLALEVEEETHFAVFASEGVFVIVECGWILFQL